MTDLTSFIAGLPKAELHVHHVGSASPRIVAELAARHEGSTPVPADPAALADYFTFRDFAPLHRGLPVSVVDLIRDAEDVRMLTYEVARELARQQVRYAELTVTPYSRVRRGDPGAGVLRGDRGRPARRRAPTSASSCAGASTSPARPACRPPRRRCGSPSSERPDGLVSFGLGGPEIGVPRAAVQAATSTQARAAGLHSVPHAGETTGPETIWDAIRDLGAERIGHGIVRGPGPGAAGVPGRARRSRSRCARPPTCAPGRSPSLDEHPLPALVAAGVPVTINSDDPPMFGTTLERRVRGRRPTCSAWTRPASPTWPGPRSAPRSSTGAARRALLAEIDAYAATNA